MRIDLNSDMGESFGRYTLGRDEDVLRFITSANVACGFHASDPLVMEKTIKAALKNGVGVGAHPGYPDLVGFGRRRMHASTEEVRGDVLYQLGAIDGIARACGAKLQHIKMHGALYNTAHADEATALGAVRAAADFDRSLIMVVMAGPAGENIRKLAEDHGLKVAAEAFADRAYSSDGRLYPRGLPGAVIHDPEETAERCVRMAKEGTLVSIDGEVIELKADTICVHGDNDAALALVQKVRDRLTAEGIELTPLGRFI